MSAAPLTPVEQAQWPDTKQPAIIGSLSTFLVLSNGFVLARLFCQLKIFKSYLVEDAFLLFAVVRALFHYTYHFQEESQLTSLTFP